MNNDWNTSLNEFISFLKSNLENIDDSLIKESLKNKEIAVIQYPEGELSASYGIILGILEEKTYKFIYPILKKAPLVCFR